MKSAEPYSRYDILSGSLKEGVRDNEFLMELFFSFSGSAPFIANFETDSLTNLNEYKTNLNEY